MTSQVSHLILAGLYFGVAGGSLQVAAEADADRGVRFGALVGAFGGREAVFAHALAVVEGWGAGEGRLRHLPADALAGGLELV